MKIKLKVKDFSGNTIKLEKEMVGKDHLKAQQKYKFQIYKDKTKYTRKEKYKKDYKNSNI